VKPDDGRHLRDDQMIAVHVGAGLRRHDRAMGHLQACPECARRYEDVVLQIDALRDEGRREADAAFTPARLESQRLQILDRLEHAGHPARVIPFPARGSQQLSIFTGTQVRRWIAAAAAAGMILGLTLGRMIEPGSRPAPAGHVASASPTARPAASHPPLEPGAKPDDEEVLGRSLYLHPVGALEDLDAMTPRVVAMNVK
jgi:anti-sigma factor RsiW